MSHHSQQVDPEIVKHFNNQFKELMDVSAKDLNLGATGKFPDGHLTEQDEGEIQIAITQTQGKIILNFGTPIAWIGLTPEQAESIAYSLIDNAVKAKIK